MIELKKVEETVILTAVCSGSEEETAASLRELEDLVSTAGAKTLGVLVQNRENVHPGTYLGKGKLDELREMIWEKGATGIVCDDELSPAQLRNLEEALDTKVMDRTMVILDIFASRAATREGKIQVELAQLRYRAVRLTGMGRRIGQLKEELAEVKRHREVTRQQRERDFVLRAAIVGYTNAGKSTLLNRLTGAGILAEDKLFATLDPTTRSYVMEDGEKILLTDTVGFIRKLPHHLIEAFRSTLEEARYSDIILHVVDCASPQMDMQMHVVRETLRDLEIVDKTTVTVFNKTDLWEEMDPDGERKLPRDFSSDYQVRISAKTGEGLGELADILKSIIRSRRIYLEKIYPYTQAGRIQEIRKYGQLLSEEYKEEGILVKAYVPAELFGRLYGE